MSNIGATSSSQIANQIYQYGQFYRVTRGITQSQFENPQICNKSAPLEDGMIRDPGALHRAVTVVNLSGKDITFVLDRDQRINKNLPSYRENETEIDGVFVPNGTSTHFNVPNFCYHVSVSQRVQSEDGKEFNLTYEGFPLNKIENKTITYNDNSVRGLVDTNLLSAKLNNYAVIKNATSLPLTVKITKTLTAYAPSAADLNKNMNSREPDNGGQIVKTIQLDVGQVWHFKPQSRYFTLRAICPPSQMYGASTTDDYFLDDSRVPDQSNYIEENAINVLVGQISFAFAEEARQGAVNLISYSASEIKPVNSDLVVTSRNMV